MGSDLIILQKQSGGRSLSAQEGEFIHSAITGGIAQNDFIKNHNSAIYTDKRLGTDPYGRATIEYTHSAGVEGIASELRERLQTDFAERLDLALYRGEEVTPKVTEKVTPEPQVRSTKRSKTKSKTPRKEEGFIADLFSPLPVEEQQRLYYLDNPRDIYDTIDWDTNPPINGFYETMMSIPYERREELRQQSAQMVDEPKSVVPSQPKEVDYSPRPISIEVESHLRDGSLIVDDGQVGYLKDITAYGSTFQPIEMDSGQSERMELYIAIRDSYESLYRFEANHHEENWEQREELNRLYDRFVDSYGNFNERANAKMLLLDASGRNMLSLERVEDGHFIKADIFHRPVAFSQNELTHVDTPDEALSASLNRYGAVNLDYMSELLGDGREDIIAELQGRIFYNPMVSNYEIADRFIAGNVVQKAEGIEEYLRSNPEDSRAAESLQALRDATPRPISFDELDFNFGERWIPTGIYSKFASYLYDTDVKIAYSESMDEYSVRCPQKNAKIYDQYAVKGYYRTYDGISLLKHALVNTVPDISKSAGKDDNGRDIKVRDSEAIQLANSKIEDIRNGFSDWLREQSPEFQNRLADMYNRKFNCFVRPTYDGSHQTFPDIDLKGLETHYGIADIYKSQKDCIWMLKQNGGGITDHEVGTGKTLIMSIAAYEMKRLGLAHKPMIIGLKANVAEIAECYRTAYPNARVLYATAKDFTPANRVKFFNDIKNNDWDCVIMSHDQFGKIPQSPELQQRIFQRELDSVEENLDVVRQRGAEVSRGMLRGLEKRKANLEVKLKNIEHSIRERTDDVVDFRQMGIDHIFVDESHQFKNLMFNTRHDRVAGLGNSEGSQKALNMLFAIRTIQERTGKDLGATFLSGTTISNSLTELYLLFKYLRPNELDSSLIEGPDQCINLLTFSADIGLSDMLVLAYMLF